MGHGKDRHDMRATVLRAAGDVRIEDTPDPFIATAQSRRRSRRDGTTGMRGAFTCVAL
jgi:hypothetical protein